MNALLICLPFKENKFFKKDYFSCGKQGPLFPVGIASLAGFIRKKGYNVEILDIYAEQLKWNEVVNILTKKKFDVVGISALVTQYGYLKWIVKEIKKIKDVPIVSGNGLATASYEIVLRHIPEIDVCVIGEGEITFYDLLKNSFDRLDAIPGIAYRQNGKIVKNPERELIKNLDNLPLPTYDLLEIDRYSKTKFYQTGIFNIRSHYDKLKVMPVITGRGCPYNCRFCGKVIPKLRLRSISNIIKEIKFLIENYHIEGVHFMDELTLVDKKRALELCDEMKKLNLLWDCQGRINIVDLQLLEKMKESGCVAVGFGIESGSQKILDNMNKKITVQQIKNVMSAARKVGLPVKNQLIFGYPGETIETIEETVKLMKGICDPGRMFTYICPLPGTELYKETLEKNMIGNEEQFLYKIKESFDENKPVINFTTFKIEKIPEIMEYYCNKMLFNHFLYLVKHPIFFLKRFIQFKRATINLVKTCLLFIFKKNPDLV